MIERDVIVTTRLRAAASLYRIGVVTDQDDSPHKLRGDVKGELYYAFAEHDQSVPANIIPDLKAALESAGMKHALGIYPGTHHGFCFPEWQVYDTIAAEATWERTFALWDRHLR